MAFQLPRSFGLALLLLASAGHAEPPESTAAVSPGGKAENSPRKICRTVETIGSRLQSRKVCMTADEWRAMARNARDNTEQRMRVPHQEAFGG